MTLLLVIRHGQTDWNVEGRIQGRTDRPLTETSRAALASRRVPQEWRGHVCLSSPLRRAMDTARLIDLSPQPEPRLVEMDWGEWEGRRLVELRSELGEEMVRNEARGLDFRPPGGESPRDVQQRLSPLLPSLEQATIAVTHKGVLRALYALATGWTMQGKARDKLIEGRAHVFEIDALGALSVHQLNLPLDTVR